MTVSLNLLVLRVADLEASRRFYKTLGLTFTLERHGSGPEHLAAEVNGIVFELYPRGNGPSTTGLRLGFQVESLVEIITALEQSGSQTISPPKEGPWGLRALATDPDGHRVEITQFAPFPGS